MASFPVEIFGLITLYLDRSDVSNLRMVCRDFEAKVSQQYFRNVVVPFRSDLYANLTRDDDSSSNSAASSLLAPGLRIFEAFGPFIRRFALSLELCENSLAFPPCKSTQKAVPAFWGIYRWPHEDYYRYRDFERLEMTADEMSGMRAALKCLNKVQNLGLSCDGGLGFLRGPDTSAQMAQIQHHVFSHADWNHGRHSLQTPNDPLETVSDFNNVLQTRSTHPSHIEYKLALLHDMVAEAGYTGPQADAALEVMLETEHTNLANIQLDDNANSILSDGSSIRASSPEPWEVTVTQTHDLVPAQLYRAQKEMLLELEWAHRAMIQSYALAIIDNAAADCFKYLTTFTIARIPSCHVHLFCRHDLWQAMTSLENFSLGVIADWRRVTSTALGLVEYNNVAPVESINKTFCFLDSYVGQYANIKSIHFEWICGGEFAPGIYQRQAYILPAPFYQEENLMIDATSVRRETSKYLRLPHVKHLSLKNCWSPPHLFLQMIRKLALASLEKLELESFSLSGPPTSEVQTPLPLAWVLPTPLACKDPMNRHDDGLREDNYPHTLHATAPVGSDEGASFESAVQALHQHLADGYTSWQTNVTPQEWNELHDILTWPGLIKHFSYGFSNVGANGEQADADVDAAALIAWIASVDRYVPGAAELREERSKYRIRCLSFKSCGYVAVGASHIDSRSLVTGRRLRHLPLEKDVLPLLECMQNCKSSLLAKILPYLKHEEQHSLFRLGMVTGWASIYTQRTINDARRDGVFCPGCSRFSGIIRQQDGA